MQKVAVVGAGLVGRGWAIVFARAGREVALYDSDAAALDAAASLIDGSLADLEAHQLVADAVAIRRRFLPTTSLAAALDGAGYVQECVPEEIEVKTAVFKALGATGRRRRHPC